MLKELIRKISKDTLWVLLLNTVNYLSSFILAVLISGFLGVEGLGEYSFIFAFVLILGIVSDFGLSTLIIRKISRNKIKAKELIFDINIIKVFLSMCLIIILFVATFFFFKKYFYPAFLTGVLIILPRSLMSTYESSLRCLLSQTYPVIVKSINSLLQLVCSYFLLVKGSGLGDIFLCILILDFLALTALIIVNNKVIREFYTDNETGNFVFPVLELRSKLIMTIKESSVFFLNNFLMLSIKGLNVLLLGYLTAAASIGIYSAGSKFVNGAGLLSGALFNSFYPVISSIKDNLKIKIGLTRKFIFYSFAAGLVMTILLFFLSEFLINLTFKIPESVIVLKILSFTVLPVMVYTVTQSFIFSEYGEKFLMKILISAWSLNIVLSIILIILYDYTGCAIALASTEIFIMMTQLNKFNYDIKNLQIQKATLT